MSTVPQARSAELDLLASADEEDLRASLAGLLTKRITPDAVRAMYDGAPAPDGLWAAIGADLGLAALLVGEQHGGAGASAREAAVVLTELGRTVAPVPFLTSAVMATAVLADPSATGAAAPLLADLASAGRTAALAVPFSTAPAASLPSFTVGGDGRVSGAVRSVAGALEADVLLVVTTDGVRSVRAADATITPVASLDMSRPLADLSLEDAPSELVATDPAAATRALLVGAGSLASEQAGLAAWCVATTVGYLKERRQFGRVVGGFQAIKHRLADLYVAAESASAAAVHAAAALAATEDPDDPDAAIAVHVAAAYCSEVAVQVAEEALQLHGGIGMTWEAPVHLYLKRAKADQIALGSPGWHRERLATLVDLPAPVIDS